MALTTIGGLTPAQVGAAGLKEFGAGATLAAADLNTALAEAAALAMYGHLAGVLAGGVCTATGLVVTVPSGTVYHARQLWIGGTATTTTVPDAATTYIWGCSDGELRQTSGLTPPNGYDTRTACLITKAVAAGGTATMDNTVQQRGRYADPSLTPRRCIEGSLLDLSGGVMIPIVAADPGTLVDGMCWYRSDTHALSVRVGGATKRVTLT